MRPDLAAEAWRKRQQNNRAQNMLNETFWSEPTHKGTQLKNIKDSHTL